MSAATLDLAPHVGRFVAATYVSDGALLAITLAAGARGEHQVSVFDTRDFRRVATFPVPSRARSGVSLLSSDGDLLITGDDHTVRAVDPRTGLTRWQRRFPAPQRVRLLDACAGRVLLALEAPTTETRLLRTTDGADEATFATTFTAGLSAACLGPEGQVAIASMRRVDLVGADGAARSLALAPPRFGVVDVAAFDAAGARLVLGTRAGDVLVMDVASGAVAAAHAMVDAVRAVGFWGDAPWGLGASGHFWRCGGGARLGLEDEGLVVELGLSTPGGLLAPDGASIALGDLDTQTFRVRRLPDADEVFATIAGFPCEAVAISTDGASLLANEDGVVCVDAETGRIAQMPGVAGAMDARRLTDGTLAFVGPGLELVAPGASAPRRLVDALDDATFLDRGTRGTLVVTREGLVVEVWEVASASRSVRLDLAETWVGETAEALRLAHVGPDGALWIHLTDGLVLRGDLLDGDDAVVGRLPRAGALYAHPDGESVWRVDEASVTRVALPSLAESAPWRLPVDAGVIALCLSPSGRRAVLFHRDGRLSSIDVERGQGVAIDGAETSAAERAPGEVFMVDLRTPATCAFSPDESRVAWPSDGGITFADTVTGERLGHLVIASSGRDWAVTDGASFDWSGASALRPIAPELEARLDGQPLAHEELTARGRAGLLAELTRGARRP